MKIGPTQGMDIGYYLGTYEPALIRLISILVKPGDVAADIGTHKGYITLALANRTGSDGTVVSIDPDPRDFGEMSDNCDRNNFHHVQKFSCVANDVEGLCEFSLSSALGNSSRFPNEIALPTVSSTISVKTRTLDDILRAARVSPETPVSFVKIDAEGSEPLVFQGMKRMLSLHHPAICMEVNNGSLKAGGFTAPFISQFLTPHGYRFFKLTWKRNALYRGTILLEEITEATTGNGFCFEVLAFIDHHRDRTKLNKFITRRTAVNGGNR